MDIYIHIHTLYGYIYIYTIYGYIYIYTYTLYTDIYIYTLYGYIYIHISSYIYMYCICIFIQNPSAGCQVSADTKSESPPRRLRTQKAPAPKQGIVAA